MDDNDASEMFDSSQDGGEKEKDSSEVFDSSDGFEIIKKKDRKNVVKEIITA